MSAATEPTGVVRDRRPAKSFTWLGVAIGVAAGFLAGVLLVAVLGGAQPVIRESTVTVAPRAITTGGTVITKTLVPPVVGQRLDVALNRVTRAGFDADVKGGGLFGVMVERNWEITSQSPAPGGYLEQGSTIKLEIARR
jgi:hypothetical protein